MTYLFDFPHGPEVRLFRVNLFISLRDNSVFVLLLGLTTKHYVYFCE